MGRETSIAWTDATWNPIRGCSRVSEGCRHCYAESVAARFSGAGLPYEGLTRDGKWTGEVRVVERHFLDPLRWERPRRIFVNSMSDLFHPNVTDETIDRVFAVMALAPRHTFQVLTKRPERMRKYLADTRRNIPVYNAATKITGGDFSKFPGDMANTRSSGGSWWPLPNVWLGVSVEDQATADARVPLLLQTPAAVRFVSYEPALGPVDFVPFIGGNTYRCPCGWKRTENEMTFMGCDLYVCRDCAKRVERFPPLNWIIVGGESGPHARPFHVEWARQTVADCETAGVACFVKQLGARPVGLPVPSDGRAIWRDGHFDGRLRDNHGADPAEWPEDLRVQQFPEVTHGRA